MSKDTALLERIIDQNQEIISRLARVEERSETVIRRELPELANRMAEQDSRIRTLEQSVVSLDSLQRLPDQIEKLDEELGVLVSIEERVKHLESASTAKAVTKNAERIERLEKKVQWYAGALAVIIFVVSLAKTKIAELLGLS